MVTIEFEALVEHPGGHDGGEFPCRETFVLDDTGKVVYTYNLPDSPTDTFCDEDVEDYNNCPTKEDAVARLTSERNGHLEELKKLDAVLAALAAGGEYSTHTDCEEEDDEDDEDDEE